MIIINHLLKCITLKNVILANSKMSNKEPHYQPYFDIASMPLLTRLNYFGLYFLHALRCFYDVSTGLVPIS